MLPRPAVQASQGKPWRAGVGSGTQPRQGSLLVTLRVLWRGEEGCCHPLVPNKEKWPGPAWALWSALGCGTRGRGSPFLPSWLSPLPHGIPFSFLLSLSVVNTGLPARRCAGQAWTTHSPWALAPSSLWHGGQWGWERNKAYGFERMRAPGVQRQRRSRIISVR